MIGQEFRLVQHAHQQRLHAVAAQQRQQRCLTNALFPPAADEVGQVRAVLQKPGEPCGEVWRLLQLAGMQHLDRVERDKPHHRPHTQRPGRAVRQADHVVEEALFLVPQAAVAQLRHAFGNQQEVLEKLARDILINPVLPGQHESDPHQVQRVHRHPRRAIGLVERAAGRQRLAAVKQRDVVQAQEATLEDVAVIRVLAVHPPGEVEHQLVKNTLQKLAVAGARQLTFKAKDAQRRPGMDRRVHVAERPLVGRQLPVGMHVPFARHDQQLRLGKLQVDGGEGDGVEGKVPRGKPRVLPRIRHAQHIGVVQVPPVPVAAHLPFGRRRRLRRVAIQPAGNIEVVVLLGP